MTKSTRFRTALQPCETIRDPADVLARGWIAALRPLEPIRGEMAGDLHSAVETADDWTVETVIKLGAAAPDKAYDVGMRIVELTDDAWILANVGVSVFENLLHRDAVYFIGRLAADAQRVPRLREALAHVGGQRLDKAARTRLCALTRA